MSKVLSFKKPEKEINFKVFGRNVAEGKLDEASKILRDLIQCDLEAAEKITLHFKGKFEESPNIIMQTMNIKYQIEQGQQNDALMAVQNIFGVTGVESIKILEVMKELVSKEL